MIIKLCGWIIITHGDLFYVLLLSFFFFFFPFFANYVLLLSVFAFVPCAIVRERRENGSW